MNERDNILANKVKPSWGDPRGLQGEKQGSRRTPLQVKVKRQLKLEERAFVDGKWFPRLCT
jgi:hypothetical protein